MKDILDNMIKKAGSVIKSSGWFFLMKNEQYQILCKELKRRVKKYKGIKIEVTESLLMPTGDIYLTQYINGYK